MVEIVNRDSVDSMIPLITPIPSMQNSVHVLSNSIRINGSQLDFLCNSLVHCKIISRFFVHEHGLGFVQDENFNFAPQEFLIPEGFNIKISCQLPPSTSFAYENNSYFPIVIEAGNRSMTEITIIEVVGEYAKVLQQRLIINKAMYELREIFNPPDESSDERDRVCVICMSTVRSIIIEPCCHICLCEKCANLMRTQVQRKCPMCRQGNFYIEVTSFIKLTKT